jgi:hypothetical protein
MATLSTIASVLSTVEQVRLPEFKRHPLSFYAYAAVPRVADLGATASVLKLLSRERYDQLYLRETTHGNWYATIECGRLMAMLHHARLAAATAGALVVRGMRAEEFARRLTREHEDLCGHSKRGLRYDRAMPSWNHAVGSDGRSVGSAEVVGGNVVGVAGADGWTHNPALHDVVSSAVAAGSLPLVASGRDGEAVAHAGAEGATVRVAVASATLAYPLAQIARHHPAGAAGCGTPTTPHVGIGAAARAAALGEHVALVPGVYAPFALRRVSGTRTRPLVIAPVGFDTAARRAVLDGAGNGMVAAGERPQRAPLTCVVAPPVSVTSGSALDAAPAIALAHCAHVRMLGLELRRAAVGVAATECTDVVLEHCNVLCEAPVTSDADPVLDAATCAVVSGTSACGQRMLAGGLPAQVNAAGYASFAVLYVVLGLLTLFVTAGLDDATANRWLLSSAVTTVATAALVQPVTSIAIAGFGFTNAVLMQAVNRLTV